MPHRSTILDPFEQTVTLVTNRQSSTYSYSSAIANAKVANQLSPEILTQICKTLAYPLLKTA